MRFKYIINKLKREKKEEINELYWGIGIENESYLQFEEKCKILGKDMKKMISRERYSIDYRENYKQDKLNNIINEIYEDNKYYEIIQMINSHTLDKMDKNFEHKTLYNKNIEKNKNFNGNTILEEWYEYDKELKIIFSDWNKKNGNVFFDGDTFEFITKDFYNKKIEDVIKELNNTKEIFLYKINKFIKEKRIFNLGKIEYPIYNPGLNIFLSMKDRIVLFNNGTYHFHITLPTKLINHKIYDLEKFRSIHNKAIYLLQWFEPLYIITLGSPDIFSLFDKNINLSSGSMRNTISRYISLGTYNKEFSKGKLLQINIDDFRNKLNYKKNDNIWWRDRIEKKLDYNLPSNLIGLDFNIEKYYQSGFEFRIFDYFPNDILSDVLYSILLICEHSCNINDIPWCSNNPNWNNLIYNSLINGYKTTITSDEISTYLYILNIKTNIFDNIIYAEEFFFNLLYYLFDLYKSDNQILNHMSFPRKTFIKWDNFNKKQCELHLNSVN